MSKKISSTKRNWMIGFAVGVPISLAFAVVFGPTFFAIGIPIGLGVAVALNEDTDN